jgi:DinB superfamily
MEMKLSEAMLILERGPGTVDQMLRGLPDEWVRATEGGNTWSCYDVVGHLIHGEVTDWLPRARIILEHGESRTFEPFDRLAQFKEAQFKEAQLNEKRHQPLEHLLDRFKQLREQNLSALRAMHLSAEDLSRTGIHPEDGIVTLRQLISAWAVHDLTHISQISRVLAKQYESEVGPWKAYLGVLNISIDRSKDRSGDRQTATRA